MEFWLQQSKKNKRQLYVFFFPKDSRMDKGFLGAWKQKNHLAFCRHRACSGPRYQKERRTSLVAASPLKETWWPWTLHNTAKICSFPFFPMFAGSWTTQHTTTTREMCKNCWHRWGSNIGVHWWQKSLNHMARTSTKSTKQKTEVNFGIIFISLLLTIV